MKRAIYIGEPRKATRDGEIDLTFGMTGKVFYPYEDGKKKWDFRPDGLNVSHLIRRSSFVICKDINPRKRKVAHATF